MTPKLRYAAVLLAVAATVAATVAPAGRSAAAAEPCRRTVAIQSQATAGERAGTLTFAVHSGGCPAAGSVGYTVTAGSALPAADFALPSGVLRWASGDTGTRSIVASIVQDQVREAALEDFTVQLAASGAGIVVVQGTGNGRVLDDDGPDLVWAVNDRSPCMLGHGYLTTPPPPPPTTPLGFVWRTDDGTAKAGVDYVAVTGRTQTVPAGATQVDFDVTVLPRPAGTPSRWFTVRVVAVSSGTVVDALAVITIDGP